MFVAIKLKFASVCFRCQNIENRVQMTKKANLISGGLKRQSKISTRIVFVQVGERSKCLFILLSLPNLPIREGEKKRQQKRKKER